jgi:hypothetical protein
MFGCPAAYPRGVDAIEYGFDRFKNSAMHYNDLDAMGQSIGHFKVSCTGSWETVGKRIKNRFHPFA